MNKTFFVLHTVIPEYEDHVRCGDVFVEVTEENPYHGYGLFDPNDPGIIKVRRVESHNGLNVVVRKADLIEFTDDRDAAGMKLRLLRHPKFDGEDWFYEHLCGETIGPILLRNRVRFTEPHKAKVDNIDISFDNFLYDQRSGVIFFDVSYGSHGIYCDILWELYTSKMGKRSEASYITEGLGAYVSSMSKWLNASEKFKLKDSDILCLGPYKNLISRVR